MKIERRMIDRQLRIPGLIFRLIMKSPNEAKFRQLRKNSDRLRGKKTKGLYYSEEWITRKKDGTSLRICIYKSIGYSSPLEKSSPPPSTSSVGVAGLLWMHGGGYAIGNPESSTGIIRRLIAESGCVVVSPDYRLSLDSPYPAALEDCHEALLWMKENAGVLGIRDDQLMVGGESAGGGLAAALTLYERDHGGVKIAFQMPLYPMIDDRMTSESARDNNAPVWDSDANQTAWGLYLGDLEGKNVPVYAAPARATDFTCLPPAVTFVGDLEPFRDETIQYMQNLRDAGISAEFELYEGCYHAFEKMNPYAGVSRKALSFLIKTFQYAVKHYFAKQST